MKEYMVQMKPANPEAKWRFAHSPNNVNKKVFTNYKDAVAFMDVVIGMWGFYEDKYKGLGLEIDEDFIPRKYRILKRDVSKWEEV